MADEVPGPFRETSERAQHQVLALECRLAPSVQFVREGDAVWVLAERPLRLLRLQSKVAPLLEGLRHDPDVRRVLGMVPDVTWESAVALLERLSDEGLVELRWIVPDDRLPTVSVVIPVRNRPEHLRACLAAVDRLDYPRDRMEVIVVDDASSDETAACAEHWSGVWPLRVVRMPQPVGAAECRNQGAAVARGVVLAFTDSDCRPHPRWLRELVPEFVRPNVVAVGGAVLPADDDTWLDRYEAVESPLMHGWVPARVRPRGAVPYLVTANMLVRRQALIALGGFAPIHPGEDVDLVWRLCERGGRVLYRPSGIVFHDHRDRLWPFLQRRAAYATSEVVLVERHPQYRHALVVPVAMLASLSTVPCIRRFGLRVLSFALGPLVADLLLAAAQGKKRRLPLSGATLVRAELRGTLAALYWLCGTIARYYSWPLILAGSLLRRRGGRTLLAVAVASLLVTAATDHVRKRPPLDPFRFVVAHVLDDLANNAGLLLGCLRQRTLRPLAVELRLYWPRSSEQ